MSQGIFFVIFVSLLALQVKKRYLIPIVTLAVVAVSIFVFSNRICINLLFLKIVMSLSQLSIGSFAQLMALIWSSTNWSSNLMNSGQSASAVLLIATAVQLIGLMEGC